MGLIKGYEKIGSRVYYHIDFKLEDKDFVLEPSAQNPELALKMVRTLQHKGFSPRVRRIIVCDYDKSGYFTKPSEQENLSLERLEEIAITNEETPSFDKPIVQYGLGDPREVDIGD